MHTQYSKYTQDNYNITHNEEQMTEEIMVTWYFDQANLQALAANLPPFLLRSNTLKVAPLIWNATDRPTLQKRLGHPLLAN